MRGILLSAVFVVVGCGGNHGQSVCDNQVPPPAACMTACDPQPGAPNTCPMGYHCTPDGKCDAVCTPNGGECGDGYKCTADGQCLVDVAAQCASKGLPTTTISGTVFAPNGTLPLYGITVYVPSSDPGPMSDIAECSKCSDDLPGNPLVRTTSLEMPAGKFVLSDVPAGPIELVITSGKWRRVLNLPNGTMECTDNPIAAADTTLPKNSADMTPNTKSVNLPRIAISTGGADSLECLIRKLGITDSEIGTGGDAAKKIHLYSDNGSQGAGVSKFAAGGAFKDSTTLWDNSDHMKPYDIMILSCEGGQFPNTKSQTDMDAVKKYADLGGRVFLSHWHNIWVEGNTDGPGNQKPAVWGGNNGIASWSNGGNLNDPATDLIDEANNPKGTAFATWMIDPMVMGSVVKDEIAIQMGTGRSTVNQVDLTKGERWTLVKGQGGTTQNFQFTTPQEMPPDNRCGKVVFSDMHVSGGPGPGDYPGSCGASTTLTPQEKALAFMFFDISSCVGTLF